MTLTPGRIEQLIYDSYYRGRMNTGDAAAAIHSAHLESIKELEEENKKLKAAIDLPADYKVMELSKIKKELLDEMLVISRDYFEDTVDKVANALGDKTEWSNFNDRGVNAIELATQLTQTLSRYKEALEKIETWTVAHDFNPAGIANTALNEKV